MAQALVDRQVSAVLAAAGAKDVTLIDPAEVRGGFDDWLVSPLQLAGDEGDDQVRLLKFLGVR